MELTKKEFNKLEYIVGFINEISDIVSDPEDLLDCNTGDTSCLAVGFSIEDDKIVFGDAECGTNISDIKNTLKEIVSLVKSYSRTDFTKEWEKLRGE